MMQKKWMIGLLLAIPLVIGGLAFANVKAQSNDQHKSSKTFICPITGEELPCSKCCPLNNKQQNRPRASCTTTGKKNVVKKSCCSAKARKSFCSAKGRKSWCSANGKQAIEKEAPFLCPITGEELPCSKCCPLNKEK